MHVAVKKKTAKKTAKKSVARKTTAKKVAKKSTAKKSTAKKAVARKSTAKKSTAKKTTAKKAVKKAAKRSSSRIVVPPVPLDRGSRGRVNVSTAPAPRAALSTPVAPQPKQGASNRVVTAVIVGIVLLALVVWSKSSGNDDAAAPAETATATSTTTPEETATPSESATSGEAVSSVEAPSGFVALRTADGLKLRWKAPASTDGLSGYNVEIKPASGEWTSVAKVEANVLTYDVTKSDDTSWTQFRVSSVYSDGQTASAKIFGLAGQYK